MQELHPEHDPAGGGKDRKRRVESVEEATVAGEQVRGVLDVHEALQHRFPEVARNREGDEAREDDDAPEEADVVEDQVREDVFLHAEPIREKEEDDHDHVGADRAFDRLVGGNRRGHLVLAPGSAAEVGRNICAPDDEEDREHHHPVAHFIEVEKREIGGGNEGDRGPEAGRDLHLETGFAGMLRGVHFLSFHDALHRITG